MSITMASEDIEAAVGRGTVLESALSAETRNNHVTSDCSMSWSQSKARPHSHQPEVSNQGSRGCCSPLPLYLKLSYDCGQGMFLDAGCKCWDSSNPEHASAVDQLSATSLGERGMGGLGYRAWEAGCRRTWHPIVSVRGHGAETLAVSLRVCRGLLGYPGVRLSEVSTFLLHPQATGFMEEPSVIRALCSCSGFLL